MAGFRRRVYGGKRRRSSVGRRPMKRRRINRRTRTLNTQSGSARPLVTFRSRRLSRRAYNSALYNSTRFKQHYRSINSQHNTIATGTSQALMNSYEFIPINPFNFWTTGGGAVDPDGGTLPLFNSVTIRGGKIGFTIRNTDETAVSVHVYLIRNNPNRDATQTNPTARNWGFDPSIIPNFNFEWGHVVRTRKALLNNGDALTLEHRIGIRKIDFDQAAVRAGQYTWYILVGETSVTSRTLDFVRYHNLSFVGDAQ